MGCSTSLLGTYLQMVTYWTTLLRYAMIPEAHQELLHLWLFKKHRSLGCMVQGVWSAAASHRGL